MCSFLWYPTGSLISLSLLIEAVNSFTLMKRHGTTESIAARPGFNDVFLAAIAFMKMSGVPLPWK